MDLRFTQSTTAAEAEAEHLLSSHDHYDDDPLYNYNACFKQLRQTATSNVAEGRRPWMQLKPTAASSTSPSPSPSSSTSSGPRTAVLLRQLSSGCGYYDGIGGGGAAAHHHRPSPPSSSSSTSWNDDHYFFQSHHQSSLTANSDAAATAMALLHYPRQHHHDGSALAGNRTATELVEKFAEPAAVGVGLGAGAGSGTSGWSFISEEDDGDTWRAVESSTRSSGDASRSSMEGSRSVREIPSSVAERSRSFSEGSRSFGNCSSAEFMRLFYCSWVFVALILLLLLLPLLMPADLPTPPYGLMFLPVGVLVFLIIEAVLMSPPPTPSPPPMSAVPYPRGSSSVKVAG